MPDISFLEIAIRDIEAARDWYDMQQPGLGEEFAEQVESAIKRIQSTPNAFPVKHGLFKLKLVKKFPFTIFYKIESRDLIRIHACLHQRRDINSIIQKR
jgi:toxin ParE1/3/4